MLPFPQRRHIRHTEIPNGICHVTWRLQRAQAPLSADEKTILLEILKRAPEFGCTWHAAVVMDDHVHTLFTPGISRTSQRFVLSWKGASSRSITARSARTAPLWQAEYYQRWNASPRLVDLCASYIRQNPRRKWPGVEGYPWSL